MLAIVANMILPSVWAQAAASSDVFGERFSLCLASGGQVVPRSGDQRPGAPVAGALHCSLCMFTGSFDVPAGGANTINVVAYGRVESFRNFEGAKFVPLLRALQFNARGPPV